MIITIRKLIYNFQIQIDKSQFGPYNIETNELKSKSTIYKKEDKLYVE